MVGKKEGEKDYFPATGDGGRKERGEKGYCLFGMWVSSLYIVSILSICIYLPYFSRYFLPIFQVTLSFSATVWESHYPKKASEVSYWIEVMEACQ